MTDQYDDEAAELLPTPIGGTWPATTLREAIEKLRPAVAARLRVLQAEYATLEAKEAKARDAYYAKDAELAACESENELFRVICGDRSLAAKRARKRIDDTREQHGRLVAALLGVIDARSSGHDGETSDCDLCNKIQDAKRLLDHVTPQLREKQ